MISRIIIGLPHGSIFAFWEEGPLSAHLSPLPAFLSLILDFLSETTFFLYNTLGSPIDLTEMMAQEARMTVDLEGFVAEMEGQKRRSPEARLAARGTGGKRLELIAKQTLWLADGGITITVNLPN